MSRIVPCLWFHRQAEEAAHLYTSLIPDSHIDRVIRFSSDMPGGKAGDVMVVEFTLGGAPCMALNGGPAFDFTPAVSLVVNCEGQQEIDRIWGVLVDGGKPMQCGWLTDRYGVTWQVVPRAIADMMRAGDERQRERVMQALMPMVKIDMDALQRAFDGA